MAEFDPDPAPRVRRGPWVSRGVRSLLAIAALLASACSSPTTPSLSSSSPPFSEQLPAVTAVNVFGVPPTLDGVARQFAASAVLSNGSVLQVASTATWQSSDGSVATVSATGLVTAVGPGSADIQATYQGVVGSQRVTVTPVTRYTLFGVATRAGSTSPVVGATVSIRDGSNSGRTTTTDNNGYYSLGQLISGTFTLQVAKSGYNTLTRSVTLAADSRIDLSVVEIYVPPQPTPSPGTTFLKFVSEPGDWVGAGKTQSYSLSDFNWNITADSGDTRTTNHVYVSMTNFTRTPSIWWYLDLKAPGNEPLRVGTYTDARRYPFQGAQPGLSFAGDGRGCNTLTGTFTVLEIVLGPTNVVDRLRATFEQHCEGGSPALRGEISIANNPWR